MGNKSILGYIILFFFLLLFQVTVLNNVTLLGYATPLLYIYFIIILPTSVSSNWVMTLAFIMGLCVDISSNTPGMHALAVTTTAFFRNGFFLLYLPKGEETGAIVPSLNSFGIGVFVRYALSMIVTLCVILYTIEAFSLFNPLVLVYKIVGSTIFTFLLVIGINSLNISNK